MSLRLFVVMPAVVLAACSAVIGLAWISGGQAAAARRAAEAEPRTGMDILNAHACGRGETKRIIVRGVEDDFSPAGEEPGFIREGRNNAAWLPRDGAGEYDQVNADRSFTDSINVKGPVSGGIFLFRARSLNGGDNDSLNLGNLSLDPVTDVSGARGGERMQDIRTDAKWTTRGDVHYADLEAILFHKVAVAHALVRGPAGRTSYSLKSYLNDPSAPEWLDVFVQDDTAIDFIGLALCIPPTVKRGMTLVPWLPPARSPVYEGTAHLVCHHVRNQDQKCDPYVGDTVCSAAQPVACFRPGDIPAPVDADGFSPFGHWSGGSLAVTEAVRGDSFQTVGEVETFCARRFGPGWRVASLHDGIRNQSISAMGDISALNGRAWVDVPDQPYATCWARR